jgi:branched-chain amino acid transport system ATP-binding protein
MLNISDLVVHYGEVQVIHGIRMRVNEGEVVTLLGANGAGKTTTLRAISGLVQSTSGSVEFLGTDIKGMPPEKIARMGIAHVPEGRRIFPGLTVFDNLRMGACSRPRELQDKSSVGQSMQEVFALFPVLERLRARPGWTLSGGEQQMLAIGRGLMAKPKLLLLDEPSLGLAPAIVDIVFDAIREIHTAGTAVLLVEQNANMALEIADRGYVLELGSIVLEDTASQLLGNDSLRKAYLGASEA